MKNLKNHIALLFVIGLFFIFASNVFTQEFKVADDMNILSVNPRESQSTIVPPGKKSQCQSGRFLATVNAAMTPASRNALVVGRNLSGSSESGRPMQINATFNNLPNSSDYSFLTNDHDLITLNNGDVLYMTGAGSKRPLTPKPGWFDITFRDFGNGTKFGPGARSVLLTWRSTDCGETFQYVGEFDPANFGDNSCGMPQFRRNADWSINESKPYDMGGSDGQLVKADPSSNRVYMVFQCVGFAPDASKKDFTLTKNKLWKTVIASSDDAGATWKSVITQSSMGWRAGIVPLGANQYAYATSDYVSMGEKDASGNVIFYQATNGAWGWEDKTANMPKSLLSANMYAHTNIGRSPGSKNFFIVFPDTIAGKGHGHRIFFFDRATKQFAETDDPIVPSTSSMDNLIYHLEMIDMGTGPVLLYWYDINTAAKTATIRGRFITGDGEYTPDFPISKSYNLQNPSFWYGDYMTAGGYAKVPGQLSVETKFYNYFPMWVEPDNTIRFKSIVYSVPQVKVNVPNLKVITVPKSRWKPPVRAFAPVRLELPEREIRYESPSVRSQKRIEN